MTEEEFWALTDEGDFRILYCVMDKDDMAAETGVVSGVIQRWFQNGVLIDSPESCDNSDWSKARGLRFFYAEVKVVV